MKTFEKPKLTAFPTFNVPMCSETSLMPGSSFCAELPKK